MVCARVSVMVLLTIGLIASYERASALKCYHCVAVGNGTCVDGLTDAMLKECRADHRTVQLPETFKSLVLEPATNSTKRLASKPLNQNPANADISAAGDDDAEPAAVDRFHPDALAVPQKLQRRDVSRAESDYNCAVITVEAGGGIKIVQRGCVPKKYTCEYIHEETEIPGNFTCRICDTDGCNTSSRLSLGLISVLLPVGLFSFFMH